MNGKKAIMFRETIMHHGLKKMKLSRTLENPSHSVEDPE